MPGRIIDQPDIDRAPAAGDFYMVDTPAGTRRLDHSRILAQIDAAVAAGPGGPGVGGGGGTSSANLVKIHLIAVGGETFIPTPGLTDANFHAVWRNGIPQTLYTGALPVSADSYKPDEAAGRIHLGTPAVVAGENILIFYDSSGVWRKFAYTATAAGLTAFNVPGLGLSSFSQVWASMTPLIEHTGAGAIPAGGYKVNLATEEIELGDATLLGEEFFVMFKA